MTVREHLTECLKNAIKPHQVNIGKTKDEMGKGIEVGNSEVELMIASIRKRYKLQERLPEQVAEAEKPAEKAVEEPIEEPVKKPRARKPKTENATEEKPAAKRTRTKKAEKEKAKDHGEND